MKFLFRLFKYLFVSFFLSLPLSAATVDVVLFFDTTAQAKANKSYTTGIDGYAEDIIEEANLYYRNSGVDITLNCAGAVAYDYTCTDSNADISHFPSDEFVKEKQVELFGDFVVLITAPDDYDVGGIAAVNTSWGATEHLESHATYCIVSKTTGSPTTLVHEIGHNMGLQHALTQPIQRGGGGIDEYSNGYHFKARDNGTYYATIMAYNYDDNDIHHYESSIFSNPNYKYYGRAAGDEETANSARTLNTYRIFYAKNFYDNTTAPRLIEQTREVFVDSNTTSAKLHVETEGDCTNFVWYGSINGTATELTSFGTSNKEIEVTAEMLNKYDAFFCKASNAVGESTSENIEVRKCDTESVSYTFSDTAFQVNKLITIKTTINKLELRNAVTSYILFKNGKEFLRQNTSEFLVKLTEEEECTYSVGIICGQIEYRAPSQKVNVGPNPAVPPAITVNLPTNDIYTGDRLSFTVSVPGTVPSKYILYKDGVDLTIQTGNIFEISSTNAGVFKYSVGVVCNGTEFISNEFEIKILPKYPIFYVSSKGASSADGTSWAKATPYLKKAISAAAKLASDTCQIQVWVAAGEYNLYEGEHCFDTNYIEMRNNVAIYGGFKGDETDLSQRSPGNNTILTSTPPPSETDDGTDPVRYTVVSNTLKLSNMTRLDGVTIKGGYMGVSIGAGSPVIENCTITDCTYGIYCYESSPTIISCTLTKNIGDGIYVYNGSPIITNCTISDTTGWGDERIGSFAIRAYDSNVTITNCTITGNPFGIYCYNDSKEVPNSTITNCIVWGNSTYEIYPSDTTTVSYSVVKGGFEGGTGIQTGDPLLGKLSDNGGLVYTIPVLKGSSALWKGTGKGDFIPKTDARGIERPISPTIGAYEFVKPPITLPTVGTPSDTAAVVGNYISVPVNSTVTATAYILYKDGVEVARQDSNVFEITSDEAGTFNYTFGIVHDDFDYQALEVLPLLYILDTDKFFVLKNGDDSNNGASWQDAYLTVQTAIKSAYTVAKTGKSVQVWVGSGTYTASPYFELKKDVAIYGGFAGGETTLEARKSRNETIFTTAGDYVIYNNNTASNPLPNSARIDGVTITGANKDGIYNAYSNPTISKCTIINNGVKNNRHGIFNTSSNPIIKKCTITNNAQHGIRNESSSVAVITNCTIANNGNIGIVNNASSANIINCTVTGNINEGIYNYNSCSPVIKNCIIWGNTGTDIIDSSVKSTVSYCVIDGGYAGGTEIKSTDPRLGTLGNYGGLVKTIPVSADSSAIGAGTSGLDIPAYDARGVLRATPCTVGAYEFLPETQFDVWCRENGLVGEDALPDAIPYFDSITNLEKYAFGLDAKKATSYAESPYFKQTNDGTTATFEFPVNKNVAVGTSGDIVVNAWVSDNLINWIPAEATQNGTVGDLNIFKVEQVVPIGGKLFFKVEVAK